MSVLLDRRKQKPEVNIKAKEKLARIKRNSCDLEEKLPKFPKSSNFDAGSESNESFASLEWDNQHDLDSPPKDEVDLSTELLEEVAENISPSHLSSGRSVSICVNRAKYVSLETAGYSDLQPICRSINFNTSQDTLVEGNLRCSLVEALNVIEEGSIDSSQEGNKMEQNVFDGHIKVLKNEYRKVIRKIESYGKNDVQIVDKDSYKEKLNKIEEFVDQFLEKVDEIANEIDEEKDHQRYEIVRKFEIDTIKSRKKNEEEVKLKMAELISSQESSSAKIEVEIIKHSIANLKEKSVKIKEKVLKMEEVSRMTDNEVREGLIEIKEIVKKAEELEKDREKTIMESMKINVEKKEMEDMKSVVQKMIDAVETKFESLKLEDKKRGLCSTISKSISKDSVVFPETFSGSFGQNVYKFEQKFRQAIQDSQIREKDHVEVLRKHLAGNAKTLIGDHHEDLDKALKVLISYFGDKRKIWDSCKERFNKTFQGEFIKVWGRYGDESRVLAIARVIEFLRECIELSEKYSSLKQEIYNTSTLEHILKVLPREYFKGFNDLINGQEMDMQDMFKHAKNYLEEQKNSALTASTYAKDTSKKSNEERKINYHKGGKSNNDNCSYCEDGKKCKSEWDGFGCLDIYKLSEKEERSNWLYAQRLCKRCGSKFGKDHECNWSKERQHAKCQMNFCKFGAIVCRKHFNNMSKELMKWLTDNKFDIKSLNSMIFNQLSFKSNDKSSTIQVAKLTSRNREDLQQGIVSCPMEDKDLVKYFEDGLKGDGVSDDVVPIPEGESVFILNLIQGKTRPLLAFMDNGCNCFVAKEGVVEKELKSAKLRHGPIDVGVASGINVQASGEWASLLPLEDGRYQIVKGLTMKKVTQDMPKIKLLEVFNALKAENKDVKCIQNLRVPKFIGGPPDIIIGIKYQSVYPELIHQFPNGLCVYKSKLKSAFSKQNACIGGPIGALKGIDSIFSGNSLQYMQYVVHLTQAVSSYKPRMEYFPNDKYQSQIIDIDIPDLDEYLKYQIEHKEKHPDLFSTNFVRNESISEEDKKLNTSENKMSNVQSEMKKFMKLNETGLELNYKCRNCRSCQECIKGSGYERISIKQEAEQELIKASVKIDLEKGRAFADLPFKLDPHEYLADNSQVALKRLQNLCHKYKNDEGVKNDILQSFAKLRKNGHLKYYEDLSQEQVTKLEAESGYVIPWDVVWKENSLSTPARTVYDASSKTSTGYSLNDILAVGTPDIMRLLDVLLQWEIGPVAIVGDVSQFYCSIGLTEESWIYQKLLLREDMSPFGKLIKAVVASAIFGVCSSGGQSEESIKKLCDIISSDLPDVAKFLLLSRYVDDLLKSVKNHQIANDLISKTEKVLETIKMKIKGWCISGSPPPEQLTDDGQSITFSGITWFPVIDSFRINIQSLHFGKKKRGRFSADLDIYDENKHGSIENFLKDKVVTRLGCTSVTARLYDMYGKLDTPLLKKIFIIGRTRRSHGYRRHVWLPLSKD